MPARIIPSWMPIDTAPRDGTDIIIWLGGTEQRAVIARHVERPLLGKCWQYDGEYTVSVDDDVKWWMRLPLAPQQHREVTNLFDE